LRSRSTCLQKRSRLIGSRTTVPRRRLQLLQSNPAACLPRSEALNQLIELERLRLLQGEPNLTRESHPARSAACSFALSIRYPGHTRRRMGGGGSAIVESGANFGGGSVRTPLLEGPIAPAYLTTVSPKNGSTRTRARIQFAAARQNAPQRRMFDFTAFSRAK
jgi:hypothetical protein